MGKPGRSLPALVLTAVLLCAMPVIAPYINFSPETGVRSPKYTSNSWFQCVLSGLRTSDFGLSSDSGLLYAVTGPGPVTTLTATPGAQITLQWLASGATNYQSASNPDSYEIRYSSNTPPFNWSAPDTRVWKSGLTSNATAGYLITEMVTGLKPDTSYYFAIIPAYQSVTAAQSNISTATASAFGITTSTFPNGCILGDVNNDGYIDMVAMNSAAYSALFLNNGNGSFSAQGWQGPDLFSSPQTLGDVDNDGDLDLVTNGNFGTRLYRNDSGTFTSNLVWTNAEYDGTARFGDVDMDGDLDLMVGSMFGTFRLFRNDNGQLTTSGVWADTDFSAAAQYGIAFGDYDNDGDLDLACAMNGGAYPVRVYRNDNGMLTTAAAWSSTDFGGGNGMGVAWGDYNNDGTLDLLATYSSAVSRLYRNDGPGTFVSVWSGFLAVGGPAFGDFNNDGYLDIGLARANNPGVIYRNDGGTINNAACFSTQATYNASLIFADCDNDGDLDFVVSGVPSIVYRNMYAEFGSTTTAPSAPSGLFLSAQPSTGTIKMSWSPSVDNETPQAGLYYNVRFGSSTANGTVIRSSAIISGVYGSPLMGNFIRPVMGLDGDNANVGFKLKPGRLQDGVTYYWAVQAIDTTLRASPWSIMQSTVCAIPPGAVTTLVAVPGSQVLLSWVAPGDNYYAPGSTASYYEIRYTSNTSYDWANNFSTANLWKGIRPVAGMAGFGETEIITGLKPDTTYYFSIKTVDKAGNWSCASNISTAVAGAFYASWQSSGSMTANLYGGAVVGDFFGTGYSSVYMPNTPGQAGVYRNDSGILTTVALANGLGSGDISAAAGDFDNNGTLDLVTIGYGSYSAKYFKNNGSGVFTDAGWAPNIPASISVAVGDYDNDGDLDVATGDSGAGAMRIFRNDNGMFTSSWVWGATDAYVSTDRMAFGDYDNDGDLDLAATGINSGAGVRIYRNDNGVFTSTATWGVTLANTYPVAWGDYDNDGYLDLFVGNSGAMRGFHNTGGGFSTSASWVVATPAVPSGIAVGDVNNDGWLDVVGTYGSGVAVCRNNGQGVLSATPLMVSTSAIPSATASSVVLADFDRDGDLDMFVSSTAGTSVLYSNMFTEFGTGNNAPSAPSSGFGVAALNTQARVKLYWYPSTDSETSQAGLYYNVRIGSSSANTLVSGSYGSPLMGNFIRPVTGLGGDGTVVGIKLDPSRFQDGMTYSWQVQAIDAGLKASAWSAVQSYTPQIPPGAITNLVSVPGSQVLLSWSAPGDNYYAAGSTASYYEIRYTSNTSYNWSTGFSTANLWKAARPVTGIAGRAETEMVTGLKPETTYYFAIKTKDNAGNWSDLSNISTAIPSAFGLSLSTFSFIPTVMGDINNDGYIDLLGFVSPYTVVLRNNNGSFMAPVVAGNDYANIPGTLGDVDNDGDLDLVTVGSDVRLYRNNNGTFTSNNVWSETDFTTNIQSAIFGDVDMDGDLDLMIAGSGPSRLYRNDSGKLTATGVWANLDYNAVGVGGNNAIAFGDYDNDGDLDYVAVGWGTFPTRLYRNDNGVLVTSATWSNTSADYGVGNADTVAWGDYNNDGTLDLLVTQYSNGTRLYRNDGPGTFVSVWYQGTIYAHGGSFGDYNNDGYLDIAMTFETSAALVYRNDAGTVNTTPSFSTGLAQYGIVSSFADFDNDGDLDLLVGNNPPNVSMIYRNMYAECGSTTTAPAAPAGGFAVIPQPSSGTIKLIWNPSIDNETPSSGLYYNVRLGTSTSNGTVIFASSTVSGVYGYPLMGNFIRPVAGLDGDAAHVGFKIKPDRIPDGATCYWSVQAIDTTLRPGPWSAQQTFNLLYPPGDITTLVAVPGSQVKLTWIAPGDNYYAVGSSASYYAIRYSSNTPFNWGTANVWSWGRGVSGSAGVNETEIITGLMPDTTYYFAIQTVDSAGNRSGTSNISTAVASGFYSAWANTDLLAYGESVAWGDYDNDGFLDMAIGQASTAAKIYHNLNGSLTTTAVWSSGDTTGVASSIAWGDYDNDGDLDLFVGWGSVAVPIRIYRNDNGAFGQPLVPNGIALNSDFGTLRMLTLGDYDNDGDLDLAECNTANSRIYRNDNGVFTQTGVWVNSDNSSSSWAIAWGDTNNDGYLDLLVSNDSAPTRLYRNNYGTFLNTGMAINTDYGSTTITSAAFGDFNNDGYLDLLETSNPGTGITKIYRNDSGSYVGVAVWTTNGNWQANAVFGDVNNDGYLDVVAARQNGPTCVYRNVLGATTLPTVWSSSDYGATNMTALADYDNDGDLDIAVVNLGGQQARLYRNEYAEFGNINVPPSAPNSGFNIVVQPSTGTIKFTWAPATDNGTNATSQNGLYYNVRLGSSTANGTVITSSSIISGVYGSPLMGNFVRPALGLDGDMTNIGFRINPSRLVSGVTYYWAVQTIDAGLRASPWSIVQSTVCALPPGVITGLTAILGDQITLTWTAPGNNLYSGLASAYEIRYSSNAFVWSTANVWKYNRPVAGPAGTSEIEAVTGLIPGVPYQFAVKTSNPAGYWSSQSNVSVAAAAGAFYGAWSSNDTLSGGNLCAADYNNDGYIDIALSGSSNSPIRLYKNNAGTFNPVYVWNNADAITASAIDFGDYDNDGYMDIAAADATGVNGSKVYHNLGGLSFSPTAVWTNLDRNQEAAVHWFDVDNDGDLDLVIASVQGLRIYRNDNAVGVLTTRSVWANSDPLDSVGFNNCAVGDYDNDGDLDVAASGWGTKCRLYRNDNGVLLPSAVWVNPGIAQHTDIDFVDYDNNGSLDLAVSVWFGNGAQIYRNDLGASGFYYPATATTAFAGNWGSGYGYGTTLSFADYDNNGYMDMLVGAQNESRLYRNVGSVFNPTAAWYDDMAIAAYGPASSGARPVFLDYDNDGDLDVAFRYAGVGKPSVRIYRNVYAENGSTTTAPSAPATGFANVLQMSSGTVKFIWDPATDAETPSQTLFYNVKVGTNTSGSGSGSIVSGMYGSPLFGDFIRPAAGLDGDMSHIGFKMRPTRLQDGTTYYWSAQTIDSTLRPSPWSAPQQFVCNIPPGAVTNLTATKALQVTLTWTAPGDNYYTPGTPANYYEIRYSSNASFVWANANVWKSARPVGGTAGFSENETITGLKPETQYYFALKTVDNAGNWSVASNTTTVQAGAFSSPWISNSILHMYNTAWADFNGDGWPELLSAGAGYYLFRNDSGVLTKDPVWSTGDRGYSVAVGDYNNDGTLDLVTNGPQASSKGSLYLNHGGTLDASPTWICADATTSNSSVAAGDYDNDGDLDVAISAFGAAPTRIYRNDNGVFTSSSVWTNADQCQMLQFGDYDNDGDLDLATAGSILRLYRNDNGVLTAGTVWNVADAGALSTLSLKFGDFNNDGYLDILTSYSNPGGAKIYKNNAGVLTTSAFWAAAGSNGNSWIWADFGDYTNDGNLDVAVASDYGSPLKVYRNDSGTLNLAASVPMPAGSLSTPCCAFGDYDNDGDLDLAAGSGQAQSAVYRNFYADLGSTNTAPSTPDVNTFLSMPQVSSGTIKLLWNASSDDMTPSNGLYYNVRLGASTNNGTVVTSSSVISGICASSVLGNFVRPVAGLDGDSRVAIELKPGRLTDGVTYFWSVQAMDPALKTSPWSVATSSFVCSLPPGQITSLVLWGSGAQGQIGLQWVAPGDNYYAPGSAAAQYEIRYTTNVSFSWNTATVWGRKQVSGPCGTSEILPLTGFIPDITYYFAVKTVDNGGN